MTLPAAWSTPLTEGATVPDVLLKLRVRDLNPFVWKDLQTAELFKGKRFVIFSLPGAYTPLCSSEILNDLVNSTVIKTNLHSPDLLGSDQYYH